MSAFDSVLIANRGEIAVRLIDACHRLGLRAVAVYSDADRDAPHVRRADAAMRLGPAPARDSYLNVDALLKAAADSHSGAVHPGYGFLAENARFARACAEHGLTFIGPHPEAIEAMGAKTRAKAIAEQAGVPTVPGYHGEGQDDATLEAEAERIGWPLLIKASAGGGGRGMRQVSSKTELAEALSMARAEAAAAFGDSTLLLERFVPRARHVEVQVLGDGHGNRVHLFERDCSLQRKHQKLIEEAPAPGLPEMLRGNLHAWSLQLAEAIGYDSAGTVEFVYDPGSHEAWFLEMNTRLQVEHPVTELITGIDLAAWQIRVAAGEALDFGQTDMEVKGWAIEARVAAEEPANDYAPQTGILSYWRPPEGPGLRVDAGVEAGSEVGHHYDSLLAKIIAHGRDRDEARRRLHRALGMLGATGVVLNTCFLRDLLTLPEFVAGRPHTGLIPDAWPEGWARPAVLPRSLIEAALAAHLSRAQLLGDAGPWSALGAWRVTDPAGRPGACIHYLRTPAGALHRVRLIGRSGDYLAELDDDVPVEIQNAGFADDHLVYETDGGRRDLRVTTDRDAVTLMDGESTVTLDVLPPERALLGAATETAGEGEVIAPMPGCVVEVRVEAGETVKTGDTLCVLEAMKLFQTLAAPFDGTVDTVRCKTGDNVSGGALLAVVTPADDKTNRPRETGSNDTSSSRVSEADRAPTGDTHQENR